MPLLLHRAGAADEMALTASDVLTAARDRHPAFVRANVPHVTLLRFLTGYQRRLVSRILGARRDFLAQSLPIALDLKAENKPGTVGAGTAGGLPAKLVGSAVKTVPEPAGSAVEYDDPNIVVNYAEAPATSATANTLTRTGAGWTVNAFANKAVRIKSGPGFGQWRDILSNTADTLTIDGTWETLPTTASTFDIVTPVAIVDESFGAVLDLPAFAERQGYLVRVDAGGVAYVDFAKPLVARVDVGVPLPAYYAIIGGTAHFASNKLPAVYRRDGTPAPPKSADVEIKSYGDRFYDSGRLAVYEQDGHLYLQGDVDRWQDVTSIEIKLVPVPPALAALSDNLLLAESAYDTLVAHAALFAARRVNALPEHYGKVSLQEFAADASAAEDAYLGSVMLSQRASAGRIRQVW